MTKKLKYNSELIGLPGIDLEFKLCHIPFLVVNDVFGALALEGSSGTGKTTVINRLGKLNELVTGGKVKTYSADKVRYEDFNGCPIPNNENKTMDIYFMPNSISQMETVLIDEINRASYDNQEKFLSLLATREIDGIPSKCKYLYTAMNPVISSDESDTYEGVQPIDKALGERMIGLIKMTPFNQLTSDVRVKIIQSCFNQVNWIPTEEAVLSFKQFIEDSRNIYEEVKNKFSTQVANYIDYIQADLVKETKNSVRIEARRAQYLMVNILATYALDKVYNNGSIKLDFAALAGLLISFPNCLWEQTIQKEALKQAHNRAKYLLNETLTNKYIYSKNNLEKSLHELETFINSNEETTKEQVSKLINQCLPDQNTDSLNYYFYCSGAVIGLMLQKKQSIMKEQEFSRLNNVYNSLIKSEEYKNLEKLSIYYQENRSFPKDFIIPDYLLNTESQEELISGYGELIQTKFTRTMLSICHILKYELNNFEEIISFSELYLKVIKTFSSIEEKYSNINK